MGLNVFTFSGNLGKDAEQKFTQGGDSIVSFSVPVTSGFGQKEKTAWIKCDLFGKRGDSVLPFLKKGQLVAVSGEFSLDEWTGKEGDKRVTAQVRVNDVQLMGRKDGQSENVPAQKPANSAKPAKQDAFDDDSDQIPF